MIELTIKTLDSKNHKFSVEDKCTVAELKQKIEQKLGMPLNRQKLIFMGKVLSNDLKLKDLDVNGKVTHLVEVTDPDCEQRSTLPRMVPTSVRPELEAESSTNTDTSAANDARQTQATTSQIRRRRHMLPAPNQSSNNERPLTYFPTAGRAEIIRRIISDIKNCLNKLEALVREAEQMRGFHHGESDDEDSMGWFYDRDGQRERRRFYTHFNNDDESELGPFRFSSRRAIGNDLARVAPRDFASLFEELECLNLRFTPHKKRYIRMLFHSNRRNPINYNDENAGSNQRILDLTSELLHNFAHAYHAISDVTFDITVPVPRLTSEMILLPEPNDAIPIHRQENRAHSASSNSRTVTEPGATPAAEAPTVEEAVAGTETASGTDNAFIMDEENRLDEARALDVPSSSSRSQRRETVRTRSAANDAPTDRSTRRGQRDAQPRNPYFHVEIGAWAANQSNAEQFARLLQQQLQQQSQGQHPLMRQIPQADIDNNLHAPGRAVMINRGIISLAGEVNRNPNIQGRQPGEDGVYVFRVPRDGGSSQPEAIRNIVTNAIRRTLQTVTPRSQGINNEENQTNTSQPVGQQNEQEQQDVRFVEMHRVSRGVTLDENVFDPFLNCNSVHSNRRLQQRREEEHPHSHGDLPTQRRHSEIVAARNLNYIRECGCTLSNEDMAMVEQLLQYPPTSLSWVNAFLVVAARFVFTRELLAIEIHDEPIMIPNEFTAVLKLLRAYMQHLLNTSNDSRTLSETFENIANYLLGSIGGFLGAVVANPGLVHMQSNVDVILSARRFIRSRLPDLYSILTSQQSESNLAPRLYTLLGQMYIDMLAFIQCCVLDEFGLRILYTMLIAHLTEIGDRSFTRCLRYFSQAIFNQALTIIDDSHPLINTEVVHVTDRVRLYRQPFFHQSETNAIAMSHTWTQANTPVMVDVGTSTVPIPTPETSEIGTNTDLPMTCASEPRHETAGTSSSSSTNAEDAQSASASASNVQMPTLASLIAHHWDAEHVPVLSGDQNLQREEQPPFSDSYLTGMPSRKRRRIKLSRPPTNLDGLIKDNFGEAVEQLGGDIDDSERALFRDHIRELVLLRAETDEDYNPAVYPNVAAFIQSRPSLDDQQEECDDNK